MNLKIEYLDKNELKPYANNAKIHTADQVEQIKKSIREFGFNDPIAVWHENEIVEGHGRLLAAMEMDELKTVPVIRLDDLTDEQRKAYAIAHNKLTMNTDFNLDLLAMELEDIGDLDMTDFGFNEREILELTIDDSPEDISVRREEYSEADKEFAYESGVPSPTDGQSPSAEEYEYASGAGVTRQELEEYESRASQMVTRRVIIIFKTDEEEEFIRKLLKVPDGEKLGVIYLAEKMMSDE